MLSAKDLATCLLAKPKQLTFEESLYSYEEDKCRCALGIGMTKEELGSIILEGMNSDHISDIFPNHPDLEILTVIQGANDCVTAGSLSQTILAVVEGYGPLARNIRKYLRSLPYSTPFQPSNFFHLMRIIANEP